MKTFCYNKKENCDWFSEWICILQCGLALSIDQSEIVLANCLFSLLLLETLFSSIMSMSALFETIGFLSNKGATVLNTLLNCPIKFLWGKLVFYFYASLWLIAFVFPYRQQHCVQWVTL